MLTTSTAANIAGATVNLSGIPSTLDLGQRVTLVSQSTGTTATTSTSTTSGGVNYGYAIGGTNSLSLFSNSIQTSGDYALAGPKTYTAGSGPNESILLDVGGTLTVSGGELSLSDNGTNSATVNAGTLIASSLSLSGANARAAIGTLDASANDTALTATGTTAANFSIVTANLSNGRLLSLDNSAGDMRIGVLNVTGQGQLYVADGNRQSIAALNARDADLIFVLPAGVAANQTIVSVDSADISGAVVGVNDDNGRVNLTAGQSVKLIAASSSLTGDAANLTVQTSQGDFFLIQVKGNDLLMLVENVRQKAFAEGRIASLAFINQGQELLLGQGYGSALAATSGPGFRFGAFGGTGGGSSRYKTGSHVDVDGFSMLAGLAVGNDAGPGRLTLGAFFEGGWGSYDSHNSFSNHASVNGNGDTSYYGGGVLGRYEIPLGRTGRAFAAQRSEPETALSGEARASAAQDARPSVIYMDASARMGRAKADFNSGDLTYKGKDADFDSASLYYGLHGGLGYVWNINEAASFDLSAKLLWTRQESDSVSVHGNRIHFKDADSLRTRLGGRFTYAVNKQFAPYAGAYWEHEFDGKVRATMNGDNIDAPELKGDTGVGELGLSFRPFAGRDAKTSVETGAGAAGGLSFDLAVQGYTGRREGVGGSLQIKFEF